MPITHAMKNTVIEIKKCKTDDAIIKMHNYLKREEKKNQFVRKPHVITECE